MAAPRNDQEVEALEKFKSTTFSENLKLSDGILMRYLRARELDATKAVEAIKAALEWKTNHIEKPYSIEDWQSFAELEERFKIRFVGLDAEDRLVIYIKFDDWLPVKPLFEKYKTHEVLAFAYHLLTRIHLRIQNSKHQQIIGIWDNVDIGFSKIFYEVQNWSELQLVKEIIQMVDLNFPETLYKAFFINTAKPVVLAFNLVRPFMRQYTVDKILIGGKEQSSWISQMKEYLTEDLIPVHLGGTAETTKSLYDYLNVT